MISHAKRLAQSKFIRNVVIVATGTAGAQVISMAFVPVITRLYGPEGFGLLGTFMAILGIATPIAALTYPIAIVLPKSDTDAKGVAKLSGGLAIGIASLTAIFLIVGGRWLTDLLSLQAISGFLLLIPLAMLFAAFHQILQQWLTRKKQFGVMAKVAVIQALVLNSAKTGIGWFYPVGAVLIFLATLGNILHAFLLWFGLKKNLELNTSKQQFLESGEKVLALSDLKTLAKRYRDFPLYRAPQVAINALSQSLPVLLLAGFYGPTAAGFYTLGRMVLGVPSTLIGRSVGDVFYPRITEAAHNKENLFQLILKAILILAIVGFVPFALVIALGPGMFSFVFGSEWVTAGEYARWLALWMYFGFLNIPSVAATATLRLQGYFLVFEVLSTVVRVAMLLVGLLIFESDLIAISLFSLAGVLLNVSLIFLTLIKSRKFIS